MKAIIRVTSMIALLIGTTSGFAQVDKKVCQSDFKGNIEMCKDDFHANKGTCKDASQVDKDNCLLAGGDISACLDGIAAVKETCFVAAGSEKDQCRSEAKDIRANCLSGDNSCQLQCDEAHSLAVNQCQIDFDPAACNGNFACEYAVQLSQDNCIADADAAKVTCSSSCN